MNDTTPSCFIMQPSSGEFHASPSPVVLCPLLVVRDLACAIDFYQRALGARLLARDEHHSPLRVGHAELALEGARFSLRQGPAPRQGSARAPIAPPVVLELHAADAAARVGAMTAGGATLLTPLRPYADASLARVRDPFGHLWSVHPLRPGPRVTDPQRWDDGSSGHGGPSAAPTRDAATIRRAPVATQAVNAREAGGARIHLVLGPVGAGKSTFARRLAQDRSAIRLTLDDWMATLFLPDRPATGVLPWYRERAERCIDQIWTLARLLTDRGGEVVLELGLLRRDERERFYRRVSEAGLPLTLHVLDAARDVRRARVLERNRHRGPTFSMVVSPEIFELASDLWQSPEPDECEGRDVRFACTDPD